MKQPETCLSFFCCLFAGLLTPNTSLFPEAVGKEIGAKSVLPVTSNVYAKKIGSLHAFGNPSRQNILAGRHTVPLAGGDRPGCIHRSKDKYPVVFGKVFDFDNPGSWDGTSLLQNCVEETLPPYELH